jgi:hypothetical protein
MSVRHAIAELISFWDRLPELVAEDWPRLAPKLRQAVDQLPAAASDQDYSIRAARILQLLQPYERVRERLAAALDRDEVRRDAQALALIWSWPQLAHRAALAVSGTDQESSSRPAAAQRISARFEDHEPDRCLRPGTAYTLAFDVGAVAGAGAVSVGRADLGHGPDSGLADLWVELHSPDADIEPVEQVLRVPPAGPSGHRARFLVTPRRSGEADLTALFLRDRNCVQIMMLKAQVGDDTGDSAGGAVLETSRTGRPLAAAPKLRGRDLSITLVGDRITLTAARALFATLRHTDDELADIAQQVRRELRDLVGLDDPGLGLVYQAGVDIPPAVHRKAVQRLCRAGYLMFQRLFFGPQADAQLRTLGTALQSLLAEEPRRIQVVSQRPLLPWHLMCAAAEYPADNATIDDILGFRHEIEYVPLDPGAETGVLDTVIDTTTGLTAVLAVNEDIDRQGSRRLVAGQLDYWGERGGNGLQVDIRRARDSVVAALARPGRAEQLLYFYCHASSCRPGEGGGPMSSGLTLSGGDLIVLSDLYIEASPRTPLPGNPLVILNACESAALSPSFYEGFLPYLLAKGARGVVGTETDTPAVLAAAWAERFFDRLLAGEPIGSAMLAVRRELAAEHHNVLGLLYAMYCDGDTALRPGVSQCPG